MGERERNGEEEYASSPSLSIYWWNALGVAVVEETWQSSATSGDLGTIVILAPAKFPCLLEGQIYETELSLHTYQPLALNPLTYGNQYRQVTHSSPFSIYDQWARYETPCCECNVERVRDSHMGPLRVLWRFEMAPPLKTHFGPERNKALSDPWRHPHKVASCSLIYLRHHSRHFWHR